MGGGLEFTGAQMHERRAASVDGVIDLPASLAEIRDDFLSFSEADRLQLLLEFSNELPEVSQKYREHPELLERVEECQSPVFILQPETDTWLTRSGTHCGLAAGRYLRLRTRHSRGRLYGVHVFPS